MVRDFLSQKFVSEITAAAVTGVADAVHEITAGGPGSGRHKGSGYRGFGGKYYQEYGFLDPYKNKVLKGSSNGDHDLLARTRLQIKNKKGNESGVAVQNGYVRYILTPDHTAVFQHIGNESGHRAIKSFLLDKNDIKDVIMHSGDQDNAKIDRLSKDELLSRYDNEGISAAAQATYPSDHVAGMRVPKGGSSCAKCEYLADNKTDCTNAYFQKWNGSPKIPLPIDEYCSDWFEPKDIKAGTDNPEGWHGNPVEEPWHGVDLDSTIAYYTTFKGDNVIGKPIEGEALNRVKDWLKKGEKVKIFSARAETKSAIKAIEKWCLKVFGKKLEVTNVKDSYMIDLLDNAAHHVEPNTGEIKAGDESFEGKHKGTKWNEIKLKGFSGPEEEALRAMLSRIPPELLVYVSCIQSAKELNAKHGLYIPAEQMIKFNPGNIVLRQHFGGGENAIPHADLTIVHEVGHSLFDNLSDEEKLHWLSISGWMKGTKDGQAPPYEEKRPGWEHIISKWTHKAGAKFPRYYSEKNPNEDFADCFSFFIQNKANRIGDEKKKFFEDYVKEHVHNYPQVSIQSPIKAGGDYAGPNSSEEWQSTFEREWKELQNSPTFTKLRRRFEAGGEGSGCNEEVAESHGTSCGPKPKGKKPYEKMKEKFEKYQSGQSRSKFAVLGGIWPGGSAPVQIYKKMITGEWLSTSQIIQSLDQSVLEKWAKMQVAESAKGTGAWGIVDRTLSGIRRVGKAGQMFGQWTMDERTNPTTNEKEYRLAMNKANDQAKGQAGITDAQQQAALQAVQKLIGGQGLDHSISSQVLKEFATQLGLGDMKYISGAMSTWIGTPTGERAMFLKRVASDYYGRDWSKEWKGGGGGKYGYGDDTSKFKYDDLRKEALAVKALSTEYVKAAGIQYLYRETGKTILN